jgi:hypothetical protein
MLTPVFEGQSEDGFDSYAKVDGDRLQIQASPDDLSPAVRMSQVLQQAGVKASRMSLEGSRLQLA